MVLALPARASTWGWSRANDVSAQDYIADVLIRMQTHAGADRDALLPTWWAHTVAAAG